MSTVEEEQKKQEAVKQDVKVCDHIGYFVGFGFEVIPSTEGGFVCLTSQNCMMCGETLIKMTTIGASKPPEAKKSNIILDKN